MSLIASHLGLINVDLELATELGGATIKQSKLKFIEVHKRLSDGLATIAPGMYDVVFIDCPPNFNIVTKTAIVACERILIPAKPDYLSTLGIDYLIRNLKQLVSDYNEYANLDEGGQDNPISPAILGVIFTMVQLYAGRPISAQRNYIAQTRKLGVPVLTAWMRENKSVFGDAPQDGVPVVLNSYSPGTYKDVVDELKSIAAEFAAKIGLVGF